MITFAPWFWPAVCAWLATAGLLGSLWAALGYRAKTPKHTREDR